MPTVVAMLLAGILTYVVEGLIEPYIGGRLKTALALTMWLGIFYLTRRFLMRLRDE